MVIGIFSLFFICASSYLTIVLHVVMYVLMKFGLIVRVFKIDSTL